MKGNICPKCGNAVMPYKRFIREAEPYKNSKCGSCGTELRRSRNVYAYLFIMCVLATVAIVPVLILSRSAQLSDWITIGITLALLLGWMLLTNYLAWRLIGWVVVGETTKTRLL
ncbi:MAG TPA: hypothetical protein VI758_03720 [Bacteroidota bacterium]